MFYLGAAVWGAAIYPGHVTSSALRLFGETW